MMRGEAARIVELEQQVAALQTRLQELDPTAGAISGATRSHFTPVEPEECRHVSPFLRSTAV